MDISKVLDLAKEKLRISSDYELAQKTGIRKEYISMYRDGKRTPDAYACARLADAIGVDPLALLAQVEAATEKNEARRNYWRALCERVGVAVLSVFIVTVTLIPGQADAKMIDKPQISRVSNFQKLCLKVKRRLLRWLDGIAYQVRHGYA